MNKRYKTIRRVIITGQWPWDNEYDIIRMGPKSVSPGKVDSTRFKIVAQKEIAPKGAD